MTDIEKKALALMHEVRLERRMPLRTVWLDRPGRLSHEALCRAIEQHEAFRQEVSDAVEEVTQRQGKLQALLRFIIPKSDPLTDLVEDIAKELRITGASNLHTIRADDFRKALRAAIEARGGRIVWEGE